MTKILTLAAQKRNPSRQENRSLKESKRVLGVVYGHGVEPIAISVDASDVLRTYRKTGSSSLINLEIDGKKTSVLMKEVGLHPVRHEINHVDFFVVNLKETTIIHVALVFIGESEAVKTHGGVFVTNHRTLDIKCLPSDSPRNIEVDKSSLNEIGDSIKIKDLKLDPEKYEVIGLEEEEMLCSVIAKKIEEVPEEAPEEGETEVEGEEKSEEGEEGEEAAEEKKE